MAVHADDIRDPTPLRHGAYVCLDPDFDGWGAAGEVERLAADLRLENEFLASGGDPPRSIAYLRRVDAAAGGLDDDRLLHARAIVHVAAESHEPVDAFRTRLAELAPSAAAARVLGGVVAPTRYTSNALHDLAYAHRVLQQPGEQMPHAFLVPVSKTADWWAKDVLERHAYFLPRHDDDGTLRRAGHVLAAAEGVPHLLRRTYRQLVEPAPAGSYDFVNYFECADEGVPVFERILAALRDPERNPEWRFVREGPTWRGRRVAAWADLFD